MDLWLSILPQIVAVGFMVAALAWLFPVLGRVRRSALPGSGWLQAGLTLLMASVGTSFFVILPFWLVFLFTDTLSWMPEWLPVLVDYCSVLSYVLSAAGVACLALGLGRLMEWADGEWAASTAVPPPDREPDDLGR